MEEQLIQREKAFRKQNLTKYSLTRMTIDRLIWHHHSFSPQAGSTLKVQPQYLACNEQKSWKAMEQAILQADPQGKTRTPRLRFLTRSMACQSPRQR
jgi:hypothetical protein